MIKVLYRWQVARSKFLEFTAVWEATTKRIHKTVPGAQGSLMLRSLKDESEVVTLAKWDSLQSWNDFWGNERIVEMESMRELAICTSAEAFEEIGDYTTS